eukprot:GHVN01058091.1.p2 GENE.GHVN01058091.1~~GHVN01058091.1.p2  ORF type:complete len:121 (-),score=1.51 GHVN01058091.1:56-418(-)
MSCQPDENPGSSRTICQASLDPTIDPTFCFANRPESEECAEASCHATTNVCVYTPFDSPPANCETGTRPTDDIDNDCYTGNVCNGNECVPAYAPADTVCAQGPHVKLRFLKMAHYARIQV